MMQFQMNKNADYNSEYMYLIIWPGKHLKSC